MHRRSFLAGLLTAGCTPWATGDDEVQTVIPGPTDRKLIAVAEWSGMYHSDSLAVYDDGLLDRRYPEENGRGPFGPTYQEAFRVALASAAELRALERDFGSTAYANAKPAYHEEGVLDGGALTLSTLAPDRRVIVVNEPKGLPGAVQRLADHLWKLAERTQRNGKDPFEAESLPSGARLLFAHDYRHGTTYDARTLTVFDHGDVELRTTYDSSDAAHAAPDHPTPRSRVRRVDPDRLAELRALIDKLHQAELPRVHREQPRNADMHRIVTAGPRGRYDVDTTGPLAPELQHVIDWSRDLADAIGP